MTTTTTTTKAIPTIEPTGIAYYFYKEDYNFDFANVRPVVNSLSGNNSYQASGKIQSLNDVASDGDTLYGLPDSPADLPGYDFAVLFQGYLYASAGAGSYSIISHGGPGAILDDVGLIWLRPSKAYGTLWNYDNADAVNIFDDDVTTSATVNLAAGEAYPITIFFANVGGPGQADFEIKRPDGSVDLDSTPYLVGACEGTTLFQP